MKYGDFINDGREFKITNVETPTPWINYLYNGKYFSTISNNGGSISYIDNPLHGRITRYRINDVPSDRPGKYIYIKDKDSGEIWSLTWQPVGKNRKNYNIIHGFG
ncbi:MAG TPA: glycosyl transferase, partial [bacterium]|nr:glycosyl transferase [bacterium]